MVVQLDKIYFMINGNKLFPFKQVKLNKSAREGRVSELETLLKQNNLEEIMTDSPEFRLIVEWLSFQDQRDALV